MDCFLYDNGLRHERVKGEKKLIRLNSYEAKFGRDPLSLSYHTFPFKF